MEKTATVRVSARNSEEEEDDDDETTKLPGFRFHPTDEELVSFYLKRKVEKKPTEVIRHIDIYKYVPWDLPRVSIVGETEWYFFCMRGRKYRNSVRPNRVTGSGFWKATGIDKPIYAAREPHECVGLKKSLVYYRGNAGKGTKTDWMMHELRLPPPTIKTDAGLAPHSNVVTQVAEVWTVCRIFKRVPTHRKYSPDSKQNMSTGPARYNNTTNSCSTTSGSLESEHSCEHYKNFGDSVVPPKRETVMLGMDSTPVDDRSSLFLTGHFDSSGIAHHQPPSPSSGICDDWLTYGNNWDELRYVVEQVIHHKSHDFDCT